ncbi:ATP-dependent RNA helicase rok1 [Paecilomyces variotii No. 5]|uniref:ATP-dependent RNA helicase ROK1 n=1 Tax=Byssochlamys spectabilis (strain No. 5 / NBRC 109023) TaxID=1356009 RepID=V5I5B4_BYSSN|nr:ATP-dependent RNA helicase rok1 [Paecilomyces variotii No. 5]
MDAFKLLTRSIKLKPSVAKPASKPLPSAGTAENPQLFRDSESAQHGTKRKRGEDGEKAGEEDDVNLDFFSSSKGLPSLAKADASKGSKKTSYEKVESDEEEAFDTERISVMDEGEKRSILKTHKIKITDLRDLEEIQPLKSTKEPKKKKMKQGSAPVLTKKQQKEARRLYPQPLTSFRELRSRYQISRRLSANIAEQGFTVPTEVQLGSLPLLLGDGSLPKQSGSKASEPDLLVVAPTGSGKTLSFLIPAINKIVRQHHEGPEEERGILSVIVAPTKELAGQIVNEGRKLTLGTGVKITLMKKGMRVVVREQDDQQDDSNEEGEDSSESEGEEKPSAKKDSNKSTVTKSDILVTTPLLFVNALTANQTKDPAPLPTVKSLILDEADVLLDPLFREQTLTIWRACTNPQLRVGLWSATMGSSIEELTKSTIKERRELLDIADEIPLIRLVVGMKDSAVPNISHKLVYAATEHGKLLGLRQLLHPTSSVTPTETRLRPPFLIFTQTIPRAVALHSELMYDIPLEAGGSSRIAVLHSDLSDTQRSEIMKRFRKGEVWILITTDLLARGVDFRGINGVVNYDIPNSAASYVHRVGRTGRAGREGGIAVTFYTKEDIPYVKSIANVIDASEKLRGKDASEKSVQKWLLDSLPDLSKKDKKELKKHGVKARQSSIKDDKDAKLHKKMRISTKSGFDRRMENKRKGAVMGSRNRKTERPEGQESGSENEGWGGFDD